MSLMRCVSPLFTGQSSLMDLQDPNVIVGLKETDEVVRDPDHLPARGTLGLLGRWMHTVFHRLNKVHCKSMILGDAFEHAHSRTSLSASRLPSSLLFFCCRRTFAQALSSTIANEVSGR